MMHQLNDKGLVPIGSQRVQHLLAQTSRGKTDVISQPYHAMDDVLLQPSRPMRWFGALVVLVVACTLLAFVIRRS